MSEVLEARIAKLELLAEAHPESRMFLKLVVGYRRAGWPARARALLERELLLRPENPAAYLLLGRVLLDLGLWKDAQWAFRSAHALAPDYTGLLRTLAELEAEWEDEVRQGAGGVWEHADGAGPGEGGEAAGRAADWEVAWVRDEVHSESLAELYAARGLYAEAVEIYRELLGARPEDARLRARLRELEAGLEVGGGWHAGGGAEPGREYSVGGAHAGWGASEVAGLEEGGEPGVGAGDARDGGAGGGTRPDTGSDAQDVTAGPKLPPLAPGLEYVYLHVAVPEGGGAESNAAGPAADRVGGGASSGARPPAGVPQDPGSAQGTQSPNERREHVSAGDASFGGNSTAARVTEIGPGHALPPEDAARAAVHAGHAPRETDLDWLFVPAEPTTAASPDDPGAGLSALIGLAEYFVEVLEEHRPEDAETAWRTRRIALAIAREMGMDESTCRTVELASLIAGVAVDGVGVQDGACGGSDAVPAAMAGRASRAAPRHMLSGLTARLHGNELPRAVWDAVRWAGQPWHGPGAVDEPSGTAIPQAARVLGVALGVVAAMRGHGAGDARAVLEAVAALRAEAGRRYDPAVVDAAWTAVERDPGLVIGGRQWILVVGRSWELAERAAGVLRPEGFRVDVASDVSLAVDRLAGRRPPAAIILAGDLPPDDVLLFLHELHANPAGGRGARPAVVVVGVAASDRAALYDAGADLCIAPESGAGELRAGVIALMRRTAP